MKVSLNQILTTIALAGSLACSHPAPSPAPEPGDPRVTVGLEQLRTATRPYHTVDSAAAAGYAREVRDCLVHEHHGAMGYHHSNPRFADAKVEIERPEILLYERLPDGRYRLNGVEYIVPYRAWPRDSIPPMVMGQMMKREDNLKFFYLHVWAWTPNRDGIFADFHPDVACAEGTSKIFRPYTAPPAQRLGNAAADDDGVGAWEPATEKDGPGIARPVRSGPTKRRSDGHRGGGRIK